MKFSIGANVTLATGVLNVSFPLTEQLTTTGSSYITQNASIATGSWQVLDQGYNTNLRYAIFANTDLTSSCKISVTTAGTASYAANLQPGDVAIIPASGSAVIYAEAVGANSPIILQYLFIPQ